MCNGGKLKLGECTFDGKKAHLVFEEGTIDLEMFNEVDCESLKQRLSSECIRNAVYAKSIGQFMTHNTITFSSFTYCTCYEFEFKVVGAFSCFPFPGGSPGGNQPPLLRPSVHKDEEEFVKEMGNGEAKMGKVASTIPTSLPFTYGEEETKKKKSRKSKGKTKGKKAKKDEGVVEMDFLYPEDDDKNPRQRVAIHFLIKNGSNGNKSEWTITGHTDFHGEKGVVSRAQWTELAEKCIDRFDDGKEVSVFGKDEDRDLRYIELCVDHSRITYTMQNNDFQIVSSVPRSKYGKSFAKCFKQLAAGEMERYALSMFLEEKFGVYDASFADSEQEYTEEMESQGCIFDRILPFFKKACLNEVIMSSIEDCEIMTGKPLHPTFSKLLSQIQETASRKNLCRHL